MTKLRYYLTSFVVAFASAIAVMLIMRSHDEAESARSELARTKAALESLNRVAAAAPATVEAIASTNEVPAEDLQARVRELEAMVASRNAMIDSVLRASTNPVATFERVWQERQAWLDKLKTEDPERYKEIMDEREAARHRTREAFAKKAAHFLEKDTSTWPEEDRQQYLMMLELLDETWKLSEQLRDDLPQEQRREIMGALRNNMRELSPLLESERDKEFYKLATELGYADEEALAFVSYLTNIIEVTSMRSVFQNMRRAGPGLDGPGERSPPAP